MNKPRLIGALCATVFSFISMSSHASLVTGVTVEDFSSENTVNGRLDHMTIDGSGLTASGGIFGTHTSSPNGTMWQNARDADPHVLAMDGQLAHIVWDLGAVYDVAAFNVWNYNEVNITSSGANEVKITTSSADNLAGLSTTGGSVLGTFDFAQATGLNTYAGELFSNTFTGRYVRFDIISNLNGTHNRVGLSEIQFDGVLATPVPAAAWLFGSGLIGLVGIARKRKTT